LGSRSFKAGKFASSKIYCPNDKDYLITQALANTKRITKQGSALICDDGFGKETLRLESQNNFNSVAPPAQEPLTDPFPANDPFPQPSVDNSGSNNQNSFVPNYNGTPDRIIGSYTISLTPLELTINGNSFSLKGCNNHNFKATFSANNGVSFGPVASTRRAC